jgi:hypothetical protein
MSDTYLHVVKDSDSGEYRAELRALDTDALVLAGAWQARSEDALADAHAMRRDDDRLALIKQHDRLRGFVPPIMRDPDEF